MVRRGIAWARSPARSAPRCRPGRSLTSAIRPIRGGGNRMTCLPAPADAARLASFLHRHPRWSAFWDKRYGVWRVAEDDPDSALYAESRDLATVISYITTHS